MLPRPDVAYGKMVKWWNEGSSLWNKTFITTSKWSHKINQVLHFCVLYQFKDVLVNLQCFNLFLCSHKYFCFCFDEAKIGISPFTTKEKQKARLAKKQKSWSFYCLFKEKLYLCTILKHQKYAY